MGLARNTSLNSIEIVGMTYVWPSNQVKDYGSDSDSRQKNRNIKSDKTWKGGRGIAKQGSCIEEDIHPSNMKAELNIDNNDLINGMSLSQGGSYIIP